MRLGFGLGVTSMVALAITIPPVVVPGGPIPGADYTVTSQAEWDALPFASLAGKVVGVRPLPNGASYVSGVNGSAARFRRIDLAGCVITGPSVSEKPRFSDMFYLRGTRGLTLRWLDIGRGTPGTKVLLYSEVSNPCGNITVNGCTCIGVEGDPNADYSAKDSYPNTGDAILTTTVGPLSGPVTIINNDVRWCASGINVKADQPLIVSGNHVSHFYDDGIGIGWGGGADVVCEDNVVHDCMGVSTDAPRTNQTTGPHPDAIRGLGGVVNGVVIATRDWHWTLNRNVVFAGTSRGRFEMQNFLLSDGRSGAVDSGYFYVVTAIGNVAYSENGIAFAIENAKNCVLINNTAVSTRQNPTPTITTRIGSNSSDATTSGTHQIIRHVTDFLSVGGSPVLTDNLVLGKNGATIGYAGVFDDPGVLTTRAAVLAGLSRKAGGPADIAGAYDIGAIGSGAVTFATSNPGTDGSTQVPAVIPFGEPTAATLRDATQMDGIDGNGWVLDVTFNRLGLGGVANAAKVTLTADAPGFDATGAAVRRPARTIKATAPLRKPVYSQWAANTVVTPVQRVLGNGQVVTDARVVYAKRVYTSPGGTTGSTPPTHTSGTVSDGGVAWTYAGALDAGAALIPNWIAMQQRVVNGDLVVSYALDQRVFAGDAVASCMIDSGAVPTSNRKAIAVTNNSTRAYMRPNCVWITRPWQQVAGSIRVEMAVCHPFGEQLRQVAAVKFIVRDAASGSVTATVAAMVQSTIITGGNPVPVFAADVDLSGLADGLCTIEAEVYPFRGVPFLTAATGFGPAAPTAATSLHYNVQKKVPFRKGVTGAYAPVYAYVDAAAASASPQVSTDPAVAAANYFATQLAAATAIQAFNNARGHNDLTAGIIRLRAGTHVGLGGSMQNLNKGDAPLIAVPDPAAAPGSVKYSASGTTANNSPPKRYVMQGVVWTGTQRPLLDAQSDGLAAFTPGTGFTNELFLDQIDTSELSGAALAGSPIGRWGLARITNSKLPGFTSPLFLAGNARSVVELFAGNVVNGPNGSVTASKVAAIHFIGNKFSGGAGYYMPSTGYLDDPADGVNASFRRIDAAVFLANTSLPQSGAGTHSKMPGVATQTYARGFSDVQCLVEVLQPSSGSFKVIELSADGSTAGSDPTPTLPDAQLEYVTGAGEGINFLYNENGTARVQKSGIVKFTTADDFNVKADMYESGGIVAEASRVGNMDTRYMVDAIGNVIGPRVDPTPSAVNLGGEVLARGSAMGAPLGYTDDRSAKGTNAGGGNYKPAAGSALVNRVPAGMASLPFDLLGAPRLNDGTGAAGAIER